MGSIRRCVVSDTRYWPSASPPTARSSSGIVRSSGSRYSATETTFGSMTGARARFADRACTGGDDTCTGSASGRDVDTPAYMSQALFARLTGAPAKRYVVIGEGTHTVVMERNRMHLFREVQLCLDDAR